MGFSSRSLRSTRYSNPFRIDVVFTRQVLQKCFALQKQVPQCSRTFLSIICLRRMTINRASLRHLEGSDGFGHHLVATSLRVRARLAPRPSERHRRRRPMDPRAVAQVTCRHSRNPTMTIMKKLRSPISSAKQRKKPSLKADISNDTR